MVLESAKGPVSNLVETIVGEPVRGNWWAHTRAGSAFQATRWVRESTDVLTCRLVDRKITFVHRRLWPSLARLGDRIGPRRIDAIVEEHGPTGAHHLSTVLFPAWVPADMLATAAAMTELEATTVLSTCVDLPHLFPGGGPVAPLD